MDRFYRFRSRSISAAQAPRDIVFGPERKPVGKSVSKGLDKKEELKICSLELKTCLLEASALSR